MTECGPIVPIAGLSRLAGNRVPLCNPKCAEGTGALTQRSATKSPPEVGNYEHHSGLAAPSLT